MGRILFCGKSLLVNSSWFLVAFAAPGIYGCKKVIDRKVSQHKEPGTKN